MSAPCWVLRDDRGHEWECGEGIPHFPSEAAAIQRRDDLREEATTGLDLTPSLLPYICVSGIECAECDVTLDDWMDYGTHVRPDEIERFMEDCDWRPRDTEWLCGDCAVREPLDDEDGAA